MAAGRLWEQVLRRARQAVGAISKDAEAPVKAVVSRELAKKASLRARQPAATPETSRKPFSGCSPNFPYAVLVPAPEQPAPGKQHASRDYLVSRDEFMRVLQRLDFGIATIACLEGYKVG
jgi:hypothetical protein